MGGGIDREQDRDRVGDEQQQPGPQEQSAGGRPAGCGHGQSGDTEDEQHVTDGVGGADQGPGRRPRPGVECRPDQQLDEDEGGAGTDDPGLDPARAVARAAVVRQEQEPRGQQRIGKQVGDIAQCRLAVAVEEEAPARVEQVAERQAGDPGCRWPARGGRSAGD